MSERVPASTIGELDVHLSFLQRDLQRVADAVANMATREDLQQLHARIDKMATISQLAALEEKLSSGSVGGNVKKAAGFAEQALKIGALVSAIVGIVLLVADKLK